MALFVIESAWIAVSAAYPMVFDENTHIGVIQLYAHRWNPIFFHQPVHADFAGPLARQPSYLYQYLMSFPYRLLTHITDNFMLYIITLRFINIALFGYGLVLFRRLLLKTKASAALVHWVLLLFILVPVVPLLAGQINYDSLIMPLAAGAFLLAISARDQLHEHGRLPVSRCLQLLTLCMFASLVQYEFLPIFLAAVLWLAWQTRRQQLTAGLRIIENAKKGWQNTPWRQRLLIGLPFVIALFMFVEMYGINVVAYHNPLPRCDQVLSQRQCDGYAPWHRDHEALLHKTAVNTSPVRYSAGWIYRMFVQTFYTSSGGASPQAFYLSVNPLPIVFAAAVVFGGFGGLLAIIYGKRIVALYPYTGFLLFTCLLYAGLLWARNYHDYVHLGQKVAINGRYLFPVSLPAMLFITLAYRELLAKQERVRVALAVAVILLFLQGGGALTYITVSNSDWYWKNRWVVNMNYAAQRVVRPFILDKSPLPSVDRL